MRFADPWFLLALAPLPFWALYYRQNGRAMMESVRFPDTGMVTGLLKGKRPLAMHAPFTFRFVAVVLLIIALARPQTGYREEEVTSKGIDIMLALDLSSSMSASDLKPSRIESAKKVISEFIKGRRSDRIGLTVFAAQGLTRCPLTLDYPVLIKFLDDSGIGLIEDGTAIGMAIATAANRLKNSDSKSKVVILLTDGVNNRGAIDPLTSARMAKAVNVKVYTIGVGREGTFLQTVDDPARGRIQVRVRTQIDEKLLRRIAKITGGRFFRAEDEATLLKIYKTIDRMEKTDIKTKVYIRHTDWFGWLLGSALVMILLELAIPLTRWRTIP